MRHTYFQLDALGDKVMEGFTDGSNWNGWATPLFTLKQAEHIVVAWNERGWKAHYDVAKDAFVFSVNQDIETGKSDEFEEFLPIERDGMKLYPIGAFAWTWEEAETVTI